jgi:hypothetical protein
VEAVGTAVFYLLFSNRRERWGSWAHALAKTARMATRPI